MQENIQQEELKNRAEKSARKIMKLVQDKCVMLLPYLNRAILRLPFENADDLEEDGSPLEGISTDGKVVVAPPDHIIRLYRTEPERLTRIFLHLVFHCIFCHPFQYSKMDLELWDLSADLAVEGILLELNKKEITLPDDHRRRHIILELQKKVAPFTADNIYNYYIKNPQEAKKEMENASLLQQDLHLLWLSADKLASKEIISGGKGFDDSIGETMEQWKKTAEKINLEAKAFQRFQESMPGSAIDNIKEAFREKKSYRSFLRKFVSRKEELRIDQEEFDYIYYTYGMQLYGNLPLIEPLEYREDKKIHDLVIAIDTSGSCQGKIVRMFLNKTVTILKDTGMFFDRMNVHIIQCDSQIQHEARITSQRDLDEYLIGLKMKGFGGTDFRPVFERVQKLQADGEFEDLKGLLYFTDGLGTFPKTAPDFPAAFIIIEDPKEKPKVPAWAIRLNTSEEELIKC